MIAKWLRRALLSEVVALLAIAWLLTWATRMSAGTALLICLVLFVALSSLPVVVTYLMAFRHGLRPSDEFKVSTWRLAQAAALEWLAFLALFVVLQPFASWWMGPDKFAKDRPRTKLVLLVHGYFCNRAIWWWFARQLRNCGFAVATVDLEPPLASIEELVEVLKRRIEHLAAISGGEAIVIVGHSMGGLVSRAYLHRYGNARVAKLITLGTPHSGTELARLGWGFDAREMEPDSNWIRRLGRDSVLLVPTVSVWSASDNFILPQNRSQLTGAREHIMPALGHLSMLLSPKILSIALEELDGD